MLMCGIHTKLSSETLTIARIRLRPTAVRFYKYRASKIWLQLLQVIISAPKARKALKTLMMQIVSH
jgi:hypothetical protein